MNPNITVSKAQKNVWSYICFLYKVNALSIIIGNVVVIKLINVNRLDVVKNLYPFAIYIVKNVLVKNLPYKKRKNLNDRHENMLTTL